MPLRLAIWLKAFRLNTLPLSASSIIMGSALAGQAGIFRLPVLLWGLLTTILLQILSNLANDYGDAVKGTDNEGRLGPERMVQTGMISSGAMKKAVIICAILSFLSGLMLIFSATEDLMLSLIFLLLGCSAIYAAMAYTMGQNPYGYKGLGDLMVFIFFGWIGVVGIFFLHTSSLPWSVLLPASFNGFFSVAVLNINNLRDRKNDALSGKRTLIVWMGPKKGRIYHFFLVMGGALSLIIYTLLFNQSFWLWLFVVGLVPGFASLFNVLMIKDEQQLNPQLKRMAIATFLTTVLFALGVVLGK